MFGILFAFVLMDPTFYRVTDATWKSVLVGLGYGVLLAVGGAGIIMPIWLGLAGFPTPPTIPNLTLPMLAWHLIYGLLLGGAFSVIDNL